jgi:thiol-disulfide isomerase/thioredoxin
MKITSIFRLIGAFILISISKNLCAQAHIVVKVPGKSTVVFNYVKNNHSEQLNFANQSDHDSVIAKEVFISKPTHLFFSDLVINQTNKMVHQYGSLLIFPGDSITLDRRNLKIISSTAYQKLLDSILDMKEVYTVTSIRNVVEKDGVEYSLRHIESTFQKNQRKIDMLRSLYDIKYIQGIKLFNFIIKCSEICKIDVSKQSYSKYEEYLLDSCYNSMIPMLKDIASINSPFSYGIIYYLTVYNALEKGARSGNIWNDFQLMDRKTLLSEAYKSFLLFQLNNTFDGITANLEDKIRLIRKAGIEDNRFDSLMVMKSNQSMEVMDSSLLYMPLKNMKGKLFYLKDILEEGKIVYLDIWASWCVPCLAEVPYLKKESAYLKEKKIKYVGLSIDTEQDKWEKSIRTNALDANSQFIIAPDYKEKLGKVLGFKTIPKYLMLSYPNKILFFNAPRPSDSLNLHKSVNIANESLSQSR